MYGGFLIFFIVERKQKGKNYKQTLMKDTSGTPMTNSAPQLLHLVVSASPHASVHSWESPVHAHAVEARHAVAVAQTSVAEHASVQASSVQTSSIQTSETQAETSETEGLATAHQGQDDQETKGEGSGGHCCWFLEVGREVWGMKRCVFELSPC